MTTSAESWRSTIRYAHKHLSLSVLLKLMKHQSAAGGILTPSEYLLKCPCYQL